MREEPPACQSRPAGTPVSTSGASAPIRRIDGVLPDRHAGTCAASGEVHEIARHHDLTARPENRGQKTGVRVDFFGGRSGVVASLKVDSAPCFDPPSPFPLLREPRLI